MRTWWSREATTSSCDDLTRTAPREREGPGGGIRIAIGAVVALLPGNLIALLINTQILDGLISPIVLTLRRDSPVILGA
jgi:hypothetical protein